MRWTARLLYCIMLPLSAATTPTLYAVAYSDVTDEASIHVVDDMAP